MRPVDVFGSQDKHAFEREAEGDIILHVRLPCTSRRSHSRLNWQMREVFSVS